MSLRACVLAAVIGCGLAGCGGSVPQQTPRDLPPRAPLSVEEWKQLPVSEKYDAASFERLRLHDPRLKSERAWDKFMAEVVVPERKKDIPR